MGVLPVVRVAPVTPDELERRVRVAAPDEDVRVGAWHPPGGGFSVVVTVANVMWMDVRHATVKEACDIAWSRVIVRLCDEVERAKAALERARAFERER